MISPKLLKSFGSQRQQMQIQKSQNNYKTNVKVFRKLSTYVFFSVIGKNSTIWNVFFPATMLRRESKNFQNLFMIFQTKIYKQQSEVELKHKLKWKIF